MHALFSCYLHNYCFTHFRVIVYQIFQIVHIYGMPANVCGVCYRANQIDR